MSCCILSLLELLGYYAWAPNAPYQKNQGVSRPEGVYLLNVDPGSGYYVSDVPPGPGNLDWSGPFKVEMLNRKLNNEKGNAV